MFGSSGIRGVVGKEMLPATALKIGEAVGSMYKNVVIGNDPRTSSIALKNALTAGLLFTGAKIFNAGLVPTPAIGYEARKHDAGIMITASHNPPEYNGIKIFEKDGSGISMEKAEEIEKLIEKEKKYVEWNEFKKIEDVNIIPSYIEAIIDKIGFINIEAIIDCSNGAASFVTPYLLRKMGAKITSLNCNPDGFFPSHLPEPTEKNLHILRKICKEEKKFGIAHDCDGDRMVVVGKNGELIQNEKLMILFAKYENAKKLIVPIDSSMILDDYFDGEIVRTRVGDIFISQKLKGESNALGAEASGTWTFPYFSYCPDGVFAAAKFLKMAEEIDVMEEIERIKAYPMRKESIKIERRKTEEVMKKIESELEKMNYVNMVKIDGYRIEFEDSWALVRASGTEPKIRLTVEGRKKEDMEKRWEEIIEIVKRCIK